MLVNCNSARADGCCTLAPPRADCITDRCELIVTSPTFQTAQVCELKLASAGGTALRDEPSRALIFGGCCDVRGSQPLLHGFDVISANRPVLSGAWPESPIVQACQAPLVQADGTPYVHGGLSQSTLPLIPANGYDVQSSQPLMKGSYVISAHPAWWPNLNSVNVYINGVEERLQSFESDLQDLGRYLGGSATRDVLIDHRPEQFETLYDQACSLGVSSVLLRRACKLATWDLIQACRFLAGEIRTAIAEKVVHLRRRLRVAKALRSKLLRLFACIYRFRNQIILQRRYYLAHGSHPIEAPTKQGTTWVPTRLGCEPTTLH